VRTDSLPGPAGSLLLGSAHELRRDQLGTYERVMHEFGDAARLRVGPPRIGYDFDVVFTPEGAREILATRAGDYVKEAPVFTEAARVIGNGLLLSNGDQWRRDRRLLAPLFTPRRIREYVVPTATVAADTVDSVLARHPTGGPLGLRDAGTEYALGVLGRTVFGSDITEASPTLRRTIPILSRHVTRRGLAPVRVPASWPTPANRAADRARDELYGLVDNLIARRRAGENVGNDLLSMLLAARDPEDGAGLDDQEVRDQALIFLIGGHDTTAGTIAMVLHLVASHEPVQDRVRDEAAAVLGDGPIGPDELGRLTYTAQVVDETLRMYPPGHTLVRKASVDTELLGRQVPAGRIVAVSVWGIHHNPDVWPDPHRFDPDRFDEHDGAAAARDRYAHLPFGRGPRSCIGDHLAMAELTIAVASIVRACRLRPMVDEPELEAGMTLRPVDELPCWVEPWKPSAA
jgi:cytochrome P450